MSIDKIIKKINLIERNFDRSVQIAARSTMALMTKRIFTDGMNSNDSPIGDYADLTKPVKQRPIWVQNDRAPRNNKGTGKNKTKFADGYSQFKSKMGLTKKVNFRLFGSLLRDFAGGEVTESDPPTKQRAGVPKPTKLGFAHYAIVLKNDTNILKRAGLEKRFGRVFSPTKGEKIQFRKVLLKEVL